MCLYFLPYPHPPPKSRLNGGLVTPYKNFFFRFFSYYIKYFYQTLEMNKYSDLWRECFTTFVWYFAHPDYCYIKYVYLCSIIEYVNIV